MRLHTAAAVVAALFLASCVFGHTVALRLLLLAAGIVLTSIALAQDRTVQALPPIWLPFVLWAGWAALSLLWSVDRDFSLKEWRNEAFYTGAALWICYVGAQARHAAKIFGAVVVLAAALAAAIALAEFSQGFGEYQSGWHGGPGDHSSALLVLMPCVAMATWYAGRAGWPLAATLSLAGLVVLLLASGYTTLSRTLWLAFAVEFALLGILLLRRSPHALREARRTLAVAALAAAALAVGAAAFVQTQAEREQRYGAKAPGSDHRLLLWPEIARHVAERPLAGHGFGRGVLREPLQRKFGGLDENLWHAHNLFLEALLQLGVAGFALLVWLLAGTARAGWRAALAPGAAQAACGMALLAVLAGMLVRNMSDSLFIRQNALLFWGAVGVLLAWGARPWRA